MFSCHIRYILDPTKMAEFKEYATTWIALINNYGGIHHGYFIPGEACDFPDTTFSFPGLGSTGPEHIAIALFSFPTIEAYEKYRREVPLDEKCQSITARFKQSPCFLSYEQTFLSPVFK